MQIELRFDQRLDNQLYKDYANFIYKSVKQDIAKQINPKKYKLRVPLLLECPLIKWKISSKPKSIDLVPIVNNCLELVKSQGVYIIRINEYRRFPYSYTKVSTVIRILEYGTESIPMYQVIRLVLNKYRIQYKYLFYKYMEETFGLWVFIYMMKHWLIN